MPEKINWTLNVQIAGGPKISAIDTMDVEAYDKIQITVENGSSTRVEVQPSSMTGQVQFLLISSDYYGAGLTYVVNPPDSGAEPVPIALDGPHIFIGPGTVKLLDPASGPQTLVFTNNLSDPDTGDPVQATVQILVGRDATP
jgi:hypothetical protein